MAVVLFCKMVRLACLTTFTQLTCSIHGRSGNKLLRGIVEFLYFTGSSMLNSQRVFVDAVRQYCARNNVSVELRSQGWLIIMQRGPQRQLAFGYDLGLNSAVAHRIANDKAATSEVLQASDIPCIPHTLFLNPALYEYVPPQRSWERMLRLIKDHPAGLVVKPNDGTSGKSVCKVLTELDLELAAHRIFASNQSLAISPYVEIQQEIRVVLLDDQPIVAYGKQRPSIVGDGKRSVLELALAGTPAGKRASVLSSAFESSGNADLDFDTATGPAARRGLAAQSRFRRTTCPVGARRRSRRLRRDCPKGSQGHQHSLRFGRRRSGRRFLEDSRNQFRGHDGSAQRIAS